MTVHSKSASLRTTLQIATIPAALLFSVGCDPAVLEKLLREWLSLYPRPDDTGDTGFGEGPPLDLPPREVGLTFGFSEAEDLPSDVVWASCHGVPAPTDDPIGSSCNPYTGDTSCESERPILCVAIDGRAPPEGPSFDFYRGWIRGTLASSAPTLGASLTSRATADGVCRAEFGAGYRMAEFHDADGGWSFVGANGGVDTSVRHWVAIDDEAANCWRSSITP